MSFDSLLTHSVSVERVVYDADDLDDYNQPTRSVTSTTVAAMVQPKREREMLDSRSAGTPIGDHRVFLHEMTITPKDAIVWDGKRYEILGIEHHAYGSVPHLELDVRLIGEPVTT